MFACVNVCVGELSVKSHTVFEERERHRQTDRQTEIITTVGVCV